ncbi:hypothetical protein FOA52_012484 [Chlamydomonas sp. UWO 241]|nr:hypothetical protein FOA52_012484 [Chlamydomonas sp. UWO 241]
MTPEAAREALLERAKHCISGPRMRELFKHWSTSLVYSFNDDIYRSFVLLAQEDTTRQGQTYGLRALFKFYRERLSLHFDARHLAEFEDLAHRYFDYMGIDCGVRCLLEALTVGGVARAAAEAGVVLDPLTAQLLGAWDAFGRTWEDEGSDGGGGGGGSELAPGSDDAAQHARDRLRASLAEMRRQRQRQARPPDDASAIMDAGAQLDPAAGGSRQDGRGDGSGAHSHSASQRDFEAGRCRRSASAAHKQMALRAKAQPFVPASMRAQHSARPPGN